MTSEQQLIIPVTGQELGEFLIGLLGQRRTIEKIFSIPNLFVSQDQILNTLDVVSQRLEQNRHSLVAFKCAYYFKSGKVLTVYDINDFNHFTDLSLDETVGIDMNLTYLVEFPNVSIPEKQDIRIQIFSDSTKQYDFSFDFLDASPLLKYTVSASNLTWGEDVSRHIDLHMGKMIVDDLPAKIFRVLRIPRLVPISERALYVAHHSWLVIFRIYLDVCLSVFKAVGTLRRCGKSIYDKSVE